MCNDFKNLSTPPQFQLCLHIVPIMRIFISKKKKIVPINIFFYYYYYCDVNYLDKDYGKALNTIVSCLFLPGSYWLIAILIDWLIDDISGVCRLLGAVRQFVHHNNFFLRSQVFISFFKVSLAVSVKILYTNRICIISYVILKI